MQCPYCTGKTKVLQTFSYMTAADPYVQRRRKCTACGAYVETMEAITVRREQDEKAKV